ncbi:MAG: prepilin-type N-terminal cleavage/methylation domain-containing protein [Burkholderiales bacterium]|nr:prepilin-type N-terminal cleavage/methylation domain-containing protein [Burkholderiales bacterium]
MNMPRPTHETAPLKRPMRHAGFTLMEMVISLVVLALLSVVMLPLLSLPSSAYMDARRRADIQNRMDLIRSKLKDDLQYAMPGSVRRTNLGVVQYLEYLEIRGYGRYRNDGTCAVPANSFVAGCAISTFDTLGPITYLSGATPGVVANSDFVAVASSTVDLYQPAGSRPMARISAAAPIATGVRLTFAANSFPPVVAGATKRAYIVVQPVTYVCNPTVNNNNLKKYWGYNVTLAQPTAFGVGVPNALISDSISTCNIGVDPTHTIGIMKSVVSLAVRLSKATAGQPADFMDGFIQVGVREP